MTSSGEDMNRRRNLIKRNLKMINLNYPDLIVHSVSTLWRPSPDTRKITELDESELEYLRHDFRGTAAIVMPPEPPKPTKRDTTSKRKAKTTETPAPKTSKAAKTHRDRATEKEMRGADNIVVADDGDVMENVSPGELKSSSGTSQDKTIRCSTSSDGDSSFKG